MAKKYRRQSERQFVQAKIRFKALKEVKIFLIKHAFASEERHFYSSDNLWHNAVSYETRCAVCQNTFYRWLHRWTREGMLDRHHHCRGWFVWHTFALPTQQFIDAISGENFLEREPF